MNPCVSQPSCNLPNFRWRREGDVWACPKCSRLYSVVYGKTYADDWKKWLLVDLGQFDAPNGIAEAWDAGVAAADVAWLAEADANAPGRRGLFNPHRGEGS